MVHRVSHSDGRRGAGTFLILALAAMADAEVPADPSGPTRHAMALPGLCAAGGIPHEISDGAVTRFSLSSREREVVGLLHLHEKTDSRNRMELANRLRGVSRRMR